MFDISEFSKLCDLTQRSTNIQRLSYSSVGHKGKFGHEFLEFEFRKDGRLRYANNSNYKNDTMIRKEAFVSPLVLKTLQKIIEESEIVK